MNFRTKVIAAVAAVVASATFAWATQLIQDEAVFQNNVTFSTGVVSANVPIRGTAGIGALTGQTNSASYINTCQQAAQVSTAGTDATPVITEFYYSEVQSIGQTIVTGVAVMNGTVASGNIKVGLADSTGAIVATSATTAMSGTDAYQRVPFTAAYTMNGPAQYYVLEFIDNTTARVNTLTFGNCDAGKVTAQVYATGFTAFTPATTFTTALGPIAGLY